MFVQHQMGHEHPSITGIYQFVGFDYRNATLKAALDCTLTQAAGDPEGTE